jgi:ATP-dependent exoDNAse (exonuclease V) beta subunit
MTIHKSKGDEFDVVFIPQFVDRYHKIDLDKITIDTENTIIPKLEKISGKSLKSIEDKKKERAYETMRLAYVAITRAKKQLFLSCEISKSKAEFFDLLSKLSKGVKV